MTRILVLMFTLSMAVQAASISAEAGTRDVGNGGDTCENRIKVIADDFRSWITVDGPAELTLPDGIQVSQYREAMLIAIAAAKVACTSAIISVGSTEKICRNSIDASGIPRIQCNREAFLGLASNADDQYRLVHHEYAGLAGLEVTHAEVSDYRISNQIAAFLEDQMVKKLAVKPVGVTVPCSSLDRSTPVPLKTRCVTSKGALYERVSRSYFGEAWKGPDGLVWGEVVNGNYTSKDAQSTCSNLGGSLPYKEDYQRAEASGIRELFPRVIDLEWFWTASIYSQYDDICFSGRTGELDRCNPGLKLNVRCVGHE